VNNQNHPLFVCLHLEASSQRDHNGDQVNAPTL